MKKIFKNWNVVRFIWLVVGLAMGIGALGDHNYFLLLPSLYFLLGSILNVGCFAQSCAVSFKKEEKGESMESKNTHFKNHES